VSTVKCHEKGGRTVDVAGLPVTAEYKSMWNCITLLGLEANGSEVCDVGLHYVKGGNCAFRVVVYLCIKGIEALGNDIFNYWILTAPHSITPLFLDACF
jgi:hypothetical protein